MIFEQKTRNPFKLILATGILSESSSKLAWNQLYPSYKKTIYILISKFHKLEKENIEMVKKNVHLIFLHYFYWNNDYAMTYEMQKILLYNTVVDPDWHAYKQ